MKSKFFEGYRTELWLARSCPFRHHHHEILGKESKDSIVQAHGEICICSGSLLRDRGPGIWKV